MVLSNYHTHSLYCDGKASLEEMADAAEASGISSLGFSAHGPVPLESAWNIDEKDMGAYTAAVRALAESRLGRMDILLGYEIDWIRGLCGPNSEFWSAVEKDYSIGSVHYLRGPDGALSTVDDQASVLESFIATSYSGDQKGLVLDYWREVKAMIDAGGFDILGHFDLVKKNNAACGLFQEEAPWYRDAAMECVAAAAASGIVAEINTGGIARGKIDDCYPAHWLLEEMRTRGIRFTVCADAHHPAHYASMRRGYDALRKAGFRECWYLSGGEWKATTLD
jgi:histidinol-phosphatase (PHP family)